MADCGHKTPTHFVRLVIVIIELLVHFTIITLKTPGDPEVKALNATVEIS